MEMLRAEELCFSYPAGEGEARVPVLDHVNLTIEKGSIVAVLGHNGSGKSTLAKQFNAVYLPSGGKMWVEQFDTANEAVLLEIRRRVGMVFQNPDNQIVANVVEEDVAFAPENLGVSTEEIRRRVDDALAAVGMSDFTRHALRRAEAARCHCRRAGHGAGVYCAGRSDRHAGSPGPAGRTGYSASAEPGQGNDRSNDHPSYG